jgi:hypothetical protein
MVSAVGIQQYERKKNGRLKTKKKKKKKKGDSNSKGKARESF